MAPSPSLKQSARSGIAPFIVMEVLAQANARAAAGAEVLHLEVGEPAGGAPPRAVEAAIAALRSQPLGYTEAFGLPALRRRLAEHYLESYGVAVEPARIALTMGASAAFVLAFLAAFDAGDRVVVTDPGYPAYRNILAALDIEVVPVPTDLETRFQPTPELLDRVPGMIHGLILASPSNPAGTMLRADELKRLARYCRQRGIRVICDEIYHGIAYDAPAESILRFERQAIVINSFSKYFCMTGWRLGWLVVPPDLVEAVTRLAQNLFISAPAIAQHAALGAFADRDELKARIGRYRRNRALLLEMLPRAGLNRFAPAEGAFYLYVDVSGITDDSVELCRAMLDQAGVAITPGVDFDPVRGHRFVRLSFAGPSAEVETAARRLCAFVEQLRSRRQAETFLAGSAA